MTCLHESSEISEGTYDERKKNDTEPGIKQIEREIERGCDMQKILLAFCGFLCCRIDCKEVMHDFFSAGIDSWKADPELKIFVICGTP